MKETIVQQCLNILKRNDVKKELRLIIDPILNILFESITPYVYVIILLIFLIFIMILAILIMMTMIIYSKNHVFQITPPFGQQH